MIRSLRALFAPALAALALMAGTAAQAAFSVATTIQSVNGTTVSTTAGTSSITVAGATYTFNDYATTGNTAGAIPAEAYTLTGTYTGPTGGTAVTVSELITVTNTNANGTTSTGTYVETSTFTLLSFGSVAMGATVAPLSQPIGDMVFTIANANATSAQFGQGINNGAISATIIATPNAVPEPASIALLGLGLVGVVARRRFAR